METFPSPLAVAWLAMTLFALLMYVCLDGFDLGIGMLLLLQPRNAHRKEMVEVVATAWDGNESWLVLVGVALFGGFPLAYSTLLPALYIPIVPMLFALILRGIAIEFQSQSETYASGWGMAFGVGSLVAAVCQGVVAGAVISGLPVVNGQFAGGPFSFAQPLCIITSAWLVSAYLLTGAGWLNDKASGKLQAWSKRVLWRGAGVAALLVVAALFLSLNLTPVVDGPINIALVVVATIVAVAALFAAASATRGAKDGRPFGFAEVALLSTTVGLGGTIYPYIVPPALPFWQALAPNSTVTFLLIGVGGCIPIVLIYNAYAYHVFRGKFVVPVPAWLAALAAAPVRSAPRKKPAEDVMVSVPSRLSAKALPLEWLRNVGWIAVWTVLFFLCLNSLGGVLGDVVDLLGVVLLIAAMVAVWIVTDRRDAARQSTLGQPGPVEPK
jgi:cytochrome bd ubiquinol oxidase subunit II